MNIIQEAESAQAAPFASSVSQDVIDDFLRHGSNTAKSRMHIIAALYPWHTPDTDWLTDKARERFANTIRREYHGGYGLIVDGVKYAAWYDDQGIRVCRGTSARYSPFSQTIPWNDVLERIWHLYGDGKYATNVDAMEAHSNECRELALSLLYLYGDCTEECRDIYFPSMKPYVGGGYPAAQARLAEALSDMDKAFAINQNLDAFMKAYDSNRSLLRSHYHKLSQISSRFTSLLVSWENVVPQVAVELSHDPFITEDEVDAALSSGSGVVGGKMRLYNYFVSTPPQTLKEKAEFLKGEYGTGGRSHALSGADNSSEDHDAKGIRLKKRDCPEIAISWPNVAKRIETLIRMNRYLTPEELAQVVAIQEAHYHPEDEYAEPDEDALPGEEAEASGDEAFDVATQKALDEEGTNNEAILVGEGNHTLYLYAPNGFKMETALGARKQSPDESIVVAAPTAYISSDYMFAHNLTFLKLNRDIPVEVFDSSMEDQLAAMKNAAASSRSEPWEAYTDAKKTFPDGIVLLRVGDDYEILGEDAERAADALGLMLSSRQTPDGRVPMCRFSMSDFGNVRKLNAKWNVRAVDYKDENHEQRISEDYPSFFNLLLQGKKTGRTRVERNYKTFARLFPEIVDGTYRYLQLRAPEETGYMPLTIEKIGDNEYSVSHYYESNGDLMYDPEMTFRIDAELGTLEPLTFRQDGSPALYQEVYPEPGKWIPKLRNSLSSFTETWLKNIEAQGRVRFRAIAERDGEDVEFSFDEAGNPVAAAAQTEPAALSDISSEAEASQVWQDEHYGSAELYAEYQRIKNTDDFIADGILLVRAGDCYQSYGEDADSVSAIIGVSKLNFAMKDFGGADKVTFAGIPDFMLEDYIEEIRDKYDVTVVSGDNVKRYLSIDHEAAKAINEHEAEFGADGWRAFGGRDYDFADEPDIPATGPVQPGEPPAAEESTSPNPAEEALDLFLASFDDPDNLREDTSTLSFDADPTSMDAAASKNGTQHDTPDPVATAEEAPPREMTQDEIDDALRAWNGREESKSAVLQYMAEHGRERGTATWLAGEYGADPAAPLILMTPTGDAEASLSWQKVQLRIAQLIRNNAFMVVEDDPQIVSTASPAESISDRQAYEIKNLADLKRHITVGSEIVCSFHRKHPEFVGLTRVVSKVQTNGFYSQIKDQPEHKWSVCNYGKGIYSDFEKAGLYRFIQTSNGTSVQLLDRRDPNHDLLMEFKVYPASAIQRDAPGQENQKPQVPAQLLQAMQPRWPVDVGDTIILEDGKPFIVEQLSDNHIQLRDPTLLYPILRSESYESFQRLMERYPQPGITEDTPVSSEEPEITYEPIAVSNDAPGDEPFDLVMQTVLHGEPKEPIQIPAENYRITDDHLGEGGPKAKFQSNMAAISTLKHIEAEGRNATPEEKEILSRYVGWGGLPEAFDDRKTEWSKEYAELKAALTPEEYTAARASTLNAHYTSPTVIRAIYSALSRMGFTTGNILEPACGVGNFFGLLPQEMSASRLYGVELDSISGRIAQKLYPNANITVAGFETTDQRDFYDVAVGNVPFGQYQVNDRAYNKLGFSIHNYFFAKALNQVRPGGVVAFITSRYTMDAKDDTVRRYLAQRADFLGAIRLPDNAFRANAGTEVVSDIIFLQKRACPSLEEPEWISTAKNIPDSSPAKVGDVVTFRTGYPPREYTATVTEVGMGYANVPYYRGKNEEREFSYISPGTVTGIERKTDLVYEINQYFLDHPEMVLGVPAVESTQYGRDDYTVKPVPGASLSEQLQQAVKNIGGLYRPPELLDLEDGAAPSAAIPADPDVRNFSYTLVNGQLYFRSGRVMTPSQETGLTKDRIKAMIGVRDCLRRVIDHQLDESVSEDVLDRDRIALNRLYDAFTKKYGLINSKANRMAFEGDSSYYLMTSLENLDEDGNLSGKADIFFKRTIKQQRSVNRVDTASEALAVSIGQKANVDLAFMAELMGGPEHIQAIVDDLQGVIFKDPASGPFDLASGGEHWDQGWQPADQYLSGNVRKKLRQAEQAAEVDSFFRVNAEALRRAQPKDLDASEIDVRIGSTWIDPEYYRQFLIETFKPSYYRQRHIKVLYSPYTGAWKIEGADRFERSGFQVTQTWGTDRKNAYDIFEDCLNLREVTVYDKVQENGKERRVLNRDETMLASQKQERLRSEFRDWIWKDPDRREALVKKYNEDMNSTHPREYDGKHLVFSGINPEIELRDHQLNAIAHVIYGGNSLLAHEVGAGKTFEMVAAAMESKRLGLCSKSLFVVPNHLVDQWASEFLRLYPAANILVTTRKDFQPKNRKRFCSRIATGDYDAIIIGQTQFEKIPISTERQIRLIQKQIDDLTQAIKEMQQDRDTPRWSVKQVERFKAQLEARLKKLQDSPRDDVVTFEELGVDRLFVDESDYYKNLYTYTKMQNVAGISNSSAQKSQDLYYKCRYMDELTGGRGLIFATGTPVSNSMTEVYIIQQYLQYQRMQELGMGFFDAWASRFGETTSQMELAPEGTGYRMRNRFAKFFNLPELMTLLKEVADIKTADQLDLPTPEVEYHNCVAKPTELQKQMMKNLSDRATLIHTGKVKPEEDNMLKITSDGRKLGLDQRIINPLLPDEPGTKVNLCVENVLRIWREGDADKLTQLIFCDISTPKARQSKKPTGQTEEAAEQSSPDFIPNLEESSDNGFTVYDDIRSKLIAGGMPPEQIAYIHDADTEAKKRELFDKMRKGIVRVLLGSTAKMGAGTNVQDRLIASHDLDCPWRPRDLIQRKGRIERQGNHNKKVHVYRYVTEDTFDAYLWQTVENKQKYIGQIMTSKSPVRSMEDVDQTALSFAEIKALCAGDPRIKERMDLEVEVSKLRLMKSAHQSQQYRMQDMLLKTYPAQISQTEQGIQALKADLELLATCPVPEDGFIGMEVRGDLLTDKENAGAALLDACKDLRNAEPIDVGSYRGFKMEAEFDIWDRALVLTLRGNASHRVELGSDPKGNLVRIENALSRISLRIEAASHYLDKLRTEQALAEKELGKPFEFEAELAEKAARLVELNHVLSLDRSKDAQEPDKAKKQYQEVR